jgi:hypothetical protein
VLAVRDAVPKARDLATAEFAMLRLTLLKITTRVVEIATRVHLAFAAACLDADLFASLPAALMSSGPRTAGREPNSPLLSLQRVQKRRSRCGEKAERRTASKRDLSKPSAITALHGE